MQNLADTEVGPPIIVVGPPIIVKTWCEIRISGRTGAVPSAIAKVLQLLPERETASDEIKLLHVWQQHMHHHLGVHAVPALKHL